MSDPDSQRGMRAALGAAVRWLARPTVRRRLIRGGLIPLALGLVLLRQEFTLTYSLADLVAAYFYGGAAVVGAVLLGFLWNLLDLIGVPKDGSAPCPRCQGTGAIR